MVIAQDCDLGRKFLSPRETAGGKQLTAPASIVNLLPGNLSEIWHC